MNRTWPCLLCFCWCLTPWAVGAVDDEALLGLSLEQLAHLPIESATGLPEPVRTAPAVASVITASDIRRMGAARLEEVLEAVPGLHVGIRNRDPIYAIRGIYTWNNPHILILINGVPLNSQFGGRFSIMHLPVAAIARVEIIRGPGSVIYGADAFAGSINVITKGTNVPDQVDAGTLVGDWHSYNAWYQQAGAWNDWRGFVSINLLGSDGDPERRVDRDLQTVFDASFGTQVSLAPGPLDTQHRNSDLRLELGWRDLTLRFWQWREFGAGHGLGIFSALQPDSDSQDQHNQVDLSWRPPAAAGDAWSHEAKAYHFVNTLETKQRVLPRGTTLPIDSEGYLFAPNSQPFTFADGLLLYYKIPETHYGLDWTSFYTGWASQVWRLAAGYSHIANTAKGAQNYSNGQPGMLTDTSDTPYNLNPETSRRSAYVSVQDVWQLTAALQLVAGVRTDDYSDFGRTTNPRLGLVWQASNRLTTKLLHGRAFRAPTFKEKYVANNPSNIGNPNLGPETITTDELIVDWLPTPLLNLSLSLFQHRMKNLVEFLPTGVASQTRAENIGRQQGEGFETLLQWHPLPSLRLQWSHAEQHGKRDGRAVPYTPRREDSWQADWQLSDHWLLTGEANAVAARPRAAGDGRPPIPDYLVGHVGLRYQALAPRWSAGLFVRNVGDSAVREPDEDGLTDLPMDGRQWRAEVSYRWP